MDVAKAVERLGGVATTHELLALGLEKLWIEMSVGYRKVIHVRRGFMRR